MKSTKNKMAIELRKRLSGEIDCEEIADWAFQMYIEHGLEFDAELDSYFLKLIAMQEGPEFILSKEELETIADQLLGIPRCVMKFGNDDIEFLSYPDFQVLDMKFSQIERNFTLKLEGAYFSNGTNEKLLGQGVLKVSDWKELHVRVFKLDPESWLPVEPTSAGNLRDLCEVKCNDADLSLSGFNDTNGLWTEWNFKNAKFEAEFMDNLS